jgi:hypothetical protein
MSMSSGMPLGRWFPFSFVWPEPTARGAATALYISSVIAAGAMLLVTLAPREYPRPWLAVALLAAALILSAFKLRLPLGRGNSTMTMA